MQRLHFLRWLALAIAVLSLQCLESLSDDCTKTLTCGDGAHAKLNARCEWVFPDGGIWEDGPIYTPEKRWIWRKTGKEVADPIPPCTVQLDGGAILLPDGGYAGAVGVEGNCNEIGCDAPLQCETISGRCVACLDNTQCASATDPSLGPTPICNQQLHACVACQRDGDCPSGTPECKTDGSNPARNECVQCESSSQCPTNETCDPATNECAARCTGIGQCLEPKPICYLTPGTAAGLCVQCVDNSTCPSATPQCNLTTKQCVPCVGPGVSTGACTADQVCNESNRCVQCLTEAQCDGETSRCNTTTSTCVACLNSAQCESPTASRCNTATYTCATCNSDAQCEPDFPFCASGRCVACKDDAQCGDGHCDQGNGTCVSCLGNGDCGDPNYARCNLPTHECLGCAGDMDCGPRFGVRQLCRENNGTCVECVINTDCATDAQAARCDTNSGLCAGCKVDSDCNSFEEQRACAGGNGNSGRCVECTDNNDCTGNPAGPTCKLSQQGGNAEPLNTCVQCVVDADCPTAAAARCVANQCTACENDANCAHVTSGGTTLGVCDTSATSPVCVQCTAQKRTACGPNVCNGFTKLCTNSEVGSAERCEPCVSDAQCVTTDRCAQQVFDGSPLDDYRCIPLSQNSACASAPFAGATTVSTVDGAQAELCALRRTTCSALLQYVSAGKSCTLSADCGADGLDDGRCDTALGLCSIPCANGLDCTGSCDLAALICEL